ncbi:MAG: Sugar phosphate isomerases/epimerase, partial [uncultured Acetobacteraceae bacterium]
AEAGAALPEHRDGAGALGPARVHRRLRAPRHPRHLALARHAARHGRGPRRAARPRRRAGGHGPLPRRHVHSGGRGRAARGRRGQPPRRGRGARAGRELPGHGVRRPAPRLQGPARRPEHGARRAARPLARGARGRRDTRAGTAAPDDLRGPLGAVHARPGARPLRRAGRGGRRRGGRVPRVVGPGPGAADAARPRANRGVPRLRLAGADHRPCVRPRDARRRLHRHTAHPRHGGSRGLRRLRRVRNPVAPVVGRRPDRRAAAGQGTPRDGVL